MKLLNKIKDRIKKELKDVESLEALDKLPKLYSPLLSKLIFKDYECNAAYYPFFNKIAIRPENIRKLVNSGTLLRHLAGKGIVSNSIATLHHEVIHTKHTGKEKKFRKAFGVYLFSSWLNFLGPVGGIVHMSIIPYVVYRASVFFKNKQREILQETHAHRGSKRYSSLKQSSKDTYDLYADDMMKTDESKDQFITADYQLKQLYALDCKDDEIGRLVDSAKWNKKKLVYDELDKRIKELTKEQKINNDDLDDLVLVDDLKRKLYFLQVQQIAQEELKKIYENIKRDKLQKTTT